MGYTHLLSCGATTCLNSESQVHVKAQNRKHDKGHWMLSSVYDTLAALLNFLHLYGSLNFPMDTEHNADNTEGHAEGRRPSREPRNLQSVHSPVPCCYTFMIAKIKHIIRVR